MSLLRTRRVRAPASRTTLALALIAGMAIVLPSAGAAASAVTRTAAIGPSGANGKATITAPAAVGTAGTLKLALKGLAASTVYPVKIVKGTCAAPGTVLYAGPAQRSTSAGKIAKTLAIPAAKMNAIRAASAVALRVGSGTRLRCGPFAGGSAPSPTPTPLAATIGAQSDVPGDPTGLATDDASVWVDDLFMAKASRLDPTTAKATSVVTYRDSLGTPLGSISGQPTLGFGSLWVPALDFNAATAQDGTARGVLLRIDTAALTVTTKISLGGRLVGTSTTGEGSVWVVQNDPSRLFRVDPTTNAVVKTIELPDAVHGVATGLGAVWVVAGTKLLRFDATDYAATSVDLGAATAAVAVGDDAVWAVLGKSGTTTAKVVRIAPASLSVTGSVAVSGSPLSVAAGGGYVWLAPGDEAYQNAIAVSTTSLGVAATVPLPGLLFRVAIRGRSAWFAGINMSGGSDVVRVDY